MENTSLSTHILALLQSSGVSFRAFEHAPTDTCESSALERNRLGIAWAGSKNICFHAKGKFYLVSTLASKDIKARAFKKPFGTKDIRFATADELALHVGAPFGCVPPVGFFNQALPIFLDADIFSLPFFLFNPAISTQTIQISGADFFALCKTLPQDIFVFQETEQEGKLEFIPLSDFSLPVAL